MYNNKCEINSYERGEKEKRGKIIKTNNKQKLIKKQKERRMRDKQKRKQKKKNKERKRERKRNTNKRNTYIYHK